MVQDLGVLENQSQNMKIDISVPTLSDSDYQMFWNKVWVKPQGCVVKVFLRGVSKDSKTVP